MTLAPLPLKRPPEKMGGFSRPFRRALARWLLRDLDLPPLRLEGLKVGKGTVSLGTNTITLGDAAGNPTAVGELQRNGGILRFYDGTVAQFASYVLARNTAALTRNNSTALTDVTGLSFAIGANEVWLFELLVRYNSSTVADLDIAVTTPAGATIQYTNTSGASTAVNTFLNQVATASAGRINAPGNGATDHFLVIHGVVINGGTAGTIQVQASQNTAEVSDTIVRANSILLATRIA